MDQPTEQEEHTEKQDSIITITTGRTSGQCLISDDRSQERPAIERTGEHVGKVEGPKGLVATTSNRLGT